MTATEVTSGPSTSSRFFHSVVLTFRVTSDILAIR
jgi:hypothetical protein